MAANTPKNLAKAFTPRNRQRSSNRNQVGDDQKTLAQQFTPRNRKRSSNAKQQQINQTENPAQEFTPRDRQRSSNAKQVQMGDQGNLAQAFTPRNRNEQTETKPRTMNCKWCPVDIELRGTTWVHVDGQPCRSHD